MFTYPNFFSIDIDFLIFITYFCLSKFYAMAKKMITRRGKSYNLTGPLPRNLFAIGGEMDSKQTGLTTDLQKKVVDVSGVKSLNTVNLPSFVNQPTKSQNDIQKVFNQNYGAVNPAFLTGNSEQSSIQTALNSGLQIAGGSKDIFGAIKPMRAFNVPTAIGPSIAHNGGAVITSVPAHIVGTPTINIGDVGKLGLQSITANMPTTLSTAPEASGAVTTASETGSSFAANAVPILNIATGLATMGMAGYNNTQIKDTSNVKKYVSANSQNPFTASNNEGLIEQYNAYTPVKPLHVKDVRNSVGSSLTNTATSGIGGALAGAGVGALAGSSGGPYGAIIGAAAGLTSGIATWMAGNANARQKTSQLNNYIRSVNARNLQGIGEMSNYVDRLNDQRIAMNYAAYGGDLNTLGNGGSIHINPANKGKLTATSRRTGKSFSELAHSSNPLTRKRAIFALNARKWNHKAYGGLIDENNNNQLDSSMLLSNPALQPYLYSKEELLNGVNSNNTPQEENNNYQNQLLNINPTREVQPAVMPITTQIPYAPVKSQLTTILNPKEYVTRTPLPVYDNSKYTASKQIRNMITKWEGSSMKTNVPIDTKFRELMNIIPRDSINRLSPYQLDALGSYYYNVKPQSFMKTVGGALGKLSTARDINEYNNILAEIAKGINIGMRNRKLPGLKTRRLAEQNIFLNGYNHFAEGGPIKHNKTTLKESIIPLFPQLFSKKDVDNLKKLHPEYFYLPQKDKLTNDQQILSIFKGNRNPSGALKAYIPDEKNIDVTDQSYIPDNRYALGGTLKENSQFSNGVTDYNSGGTHEENPNTGVQIGEDNQGTPNMVEEGEVRYKDYIFSNRLAPNRQILADNLLPMGLSGHSYAEIADRLSKESKERPNDPISKNGLESAMQRLRMAQEISKAAQEQEQQRIAALQQMQQGQQNPQDAYNMLPSPDEQQQGNNPEEQDEQDMQGDGTQQYAYGGNLFLPGGDLDNPDDDGQSVYLNNLINDWKRNHAAAIGKQIVNLNRFKQQSPATYSFPTILPDGRSLETLFTSKEQADNARKSNISEILVLNNKFKNGDITRGQYLRKVVKPMLALTSMGPTARAYGRTMAGIEGGLRQFFNTSQANRKYKDGDEFFNPYTFKMEANPVYKDASQSTPVTSTSSNNDNYKVTAEQVKEYRAKAAQSKNGVYTPDNVHFWFDKAKREQYRQSQESSASGMAVGGYSGRTSRGSSRTSADYTLMKPQAPPRDKIGSTQSIESLFPINKLSASNSLLSDDYVNQRRQALIQANENEKTRQWLAQHPYKRKFPWGDALSYASAFGPIISNIGSMFGDGKPDNRYADLVFNASRGIPNARAQMLGNYETYRPFDEMYYQNQAKMAYNAATSKIDDTASGNQAVANAQRLANNYNLYSALGATQLQGENANIARKDEVSQFNRATDQYNSQAALEADKINSNNYDIRLRGIMQAANMMNADANTYNEMKMANLGNMFTSISNIGREMQNKDQMRMIAATGGYGSIPADFLDRLGFSEREKFIINRQQGMNTEEALNAASGRGYAEPIYNNYPYALMDLYNTGNKTNSSAFGGKLRIKKTRTKHPYNSPFGSFTKLK